MGHKELDGSAAVRLKRDSVVGVVELGVEEIEEDRAKPVVARIQRTAGNHKFGFSSIVIRRCGQRKKVSLKLGLIVQLNHEGSVELLHGMFFDWDPDSSLITNGMEGDTSDVLLESVHDVIEDCLWNLNRLSGHIKHSSSLESLELVVLRQIDLAHVESPSVVCDVLYSGYFSFHLTLSKDNASIRNGQSRSIDRSLVVQLSHKGCVIVVGRR